MIDKKPEAKTAFMYTCLQRGGFWNKKSEVNEKKKMERKVGRGKVTKY
jgi:hypothetical protein